MMVELTIDGKRIECSESATILEAASASAIAIPNLCFASELEPYGACGLCVVEVEGSPKLLRACATKVKTGMVVHTRTERVLKARKLALELIMSDHEGDCLGPCRLNCPAHTDCQKYVREIAEGDFGAAWRTVMEVCPLPASLGRICPHPCETNCRRSLVEAPISIAALKAFAADEARKRGLLKMPAVAKKTGKRVFVVGAGPAGLTAAYQLARKGHEVTIYEQMPKAGGMFRYGIPEFRLPKKILQGEIDDIVSMGVKIVTSFKVGRDATLADLRSKCDAMIVANGAWLSSPMGVPGEDSKRVVGGIDFLRELPRLEGAVAIVGGGNTAMDACRMALRRGAKKSYVLYRRTRAEMPAEAVEIAEAEEEGVEFKFLRNPAEIVETANGLKVKLQVMELGPVDAKGRRRPIPVAGKFEELELSTLVMAIGQRADARGFEALPLDGVEVCGDASAKGAGYAIQAIADANETVEKISAYLSKTPYIAKPITVSERALSKEDFLEYERKPRTDGPRNAREAKREAKRCLECGCHDYRDCRLIRLVEENRIDVKRLKGEKHPAFVERSLGAIERNQAKCITCGMCVRICEEVAKKGLLGLVGRGFKTVIKPEFKGKAAIAGCVDCGLCVEYCPTGALKRLKKDGE